MRAWIIIAGPVLKEDIEFYRTIKPASQDLVICADGGFDNSVLFGFQPDLIIGDMDSVKSTIPSEIETLRFPKEKNKTDSELAIDYALEQGATEIMILGNVGGKLSHCLANIMLLRYIGDRAKAMLLSADARVCLVRNGEINISRGDDKVFSLIPLTECRGVSISGAKYEVQDIEIAIGCTHLVSNEFGAMDVEVRVREGEMLLLVENLK